MRVTLVMVTPPFPPSVLPDWSKVKSPACPLRGCHIPVWQQQFSTENARLMPHLCCLLMEPIRARFLPQILLFPQGLWGAECVGGSTDLTTTAANRQQASESGIKRFTNSWTEQVLGSCAELRRFKICHWLHFEWHSSVRLIRRSPSLLLKQSKQN